MPVNRAGKFAPTHTRPASYLRMYRTGRVSSLRTAGARAEHRIGNSGNRHRRAGRDHAGRDVVVANVQTGLTRDLITDERGWYRATAIPPGDYQVTVTLQGFATQIRRGLTVTVGQEATVNVALRVANIEESVTVTGAAPLVETTRSTLGTTVTRDSLDNLPLISRNFAGLATLAPGSPASAAAASRRRARPIAATATWWMASATTRSSPPATAAASRSRPCASSR